MAAMIPPVVRPLPLLTIRKFTSRDFTMSDLVGREMLTAEQAAVLVDAVRRGDNLLISGGTSSGKTTLLNVLADAIPEDDRILIIEDTAELHIRKPHVVSAESQTDTHRSQVAFDDLLKAVLRHRPDRIIVGEVRGREARTLLDAMNTGHRGTLATVHASGTEEALHRLALLSMRDSSGLTLTMAESEVARCIDIVAFVQRDNGLRSVREIRNLRQT